MGRRRRPIGVPLRRVRRGLAPYDELVHEEQPELGIRPPQLVVGVVEVRADLDGRSFPDYLHGGPVAQLGEITTRWTRRR